jgi:hypothetical protein
MMRSDREEREDVYREQLVRVIARRRAGMREALAESLTDAEYAYVVGRLREGAMQRLFGV